MNWPGGRWGCARVTSCFVLFTCFFVKWLDGTRSGCYTESMVTTLSDRGQTAIPARIRKRFKLKAHQRLEWADDGKVIYVLPIAKDPIAAFRGSTPKGATKALLASRRKDAARR